VVKGYNSTSSPACPFSNILAVLSPHRVIIIIIMSIMIFLGLYRSLPLEWTEKIGMGINRKEISWRFVRGPSQ